MNLKIFAKIISIVFHPLLMPTYGILFAYNSGTMIDFTPTEIKWKIYFTIFVMTFLLPVIIIAILHNYKIVKNYELSEHRDRVIPLFITLASYFTVFYMTRDLGIPFAVKKFIFAFTITVAFVFVVSVFWKISAHMAGIGGMISLVISFTLKFNGQQVILIGLLTLLAGLIGASRLKLNAHTPSQVYAGFVSGFAVVFLIFIYL